MIEVTPNVFSSPRFSLHQGQTTLFSFSLFFPFVSLKDAYVFVFRFSVQSCMFVTSRIPRLLIVLLFALRLIA